MDTGNKDDFYVEITPDEWYDLVQTKSIFFDKEYSKFEKAFKGKLILTLHRQYKKNIIGINGKDLDDIAEVNLMKDEWFLIGIFKIGKFYKCDQLEGLFRCVEDNIIL